jgi:hypothetical protein
MQARPSWQEGRSGRAGDRIEGEFPFSLLLDPGVHGRVGSTAADARRRVRPDRKVALMLADPARCYRPAASLHGARSPADGPSRRPAGPAGFSPALPAPRPRGTAASPVGGSCRTSISACGAYVCGSVAATRGGFGPGPGDRTSRCLRIPRSDRNVTRHESTEGQSYTARHGHVSSTEAASVVLKDPHAGAARTISSVDGISRARFGKTGGRGWTGENPIGGRGASIDHCRSGP